MTGTRDFTNIAQFAIFQPQWSPASSVETTGALETKVSELAEPQWSPASSVGTTRSFRYRRRPGGRAAMEPGLIGRDDGSRILGPLTCANTGPCEHPRNQGLNDPLFVDFSRFKQPLNCMRATPGVGATASSLATMSNAQTTTAPPEGIFS